MEGWDHFSLGINLTALGIKMSLVFSTTWAHRVLSTCLSGVSSHIGLMPLLLAAEALVCGEHYPPGRVFSPVFPARRLQPKHRNGVLICSSLNGGLQAILCLLQLLVPGGFRPGCCRVLGHAHFLL